MRSRLSLNSLFVLALFVANAVGQTPSITVPPVVIELSDATKPATPPAPAIPAAPGKPAPAKPAKPKKTDEQKRIEKFPKLQFDRRASAILQAWSTPPEPEPEPEPEEKKEEPKPDEEKKEGEQKPEEVKEAEKDPNAKPKKDPIDKELEVFRRNVTLGDWKAVADYFPKFAEKDRKKAYQHLLNGLLRVPKPVPPKPQPGATPAVRQPGQPVAVKGALPQYAEKHVIRPVDVIGLADAAPVDLDKDLVPVLGRLLSNALKGGELIDEFTRVVKEGTVKLGGEDSKKRGDAARILIGAGRAAEAGDFLPDAAASVQANDPESLALLAQYHLAMHAKEKDSTHLEKAWEVTQLALSLEDLKADDKTAALERALDLAPKIRDEVGQKWLEESFTKSPERGMEVLAAIGSQTSQNRSQRSSDIRSKKLELQSTAVEALLKNSPERAGEWADKLTLLGMNWLAEAEHSRTHDQTDSMRPQMQYDPFGNMYYRNYGYNRPTVSNQLQAITTAKLLEIAPSEKWLAKIDASLRPKFAMLMAQLYFKVNEAEKGFPYVEQLAETHPEQGQELANAFLDVWTDNNDPNKNKRRTSSYYYFYGFSQSANGIPLTRSKQERNLEELGKWVTRLRKLPIEGVDEEKLSKAFTTVHSSAEVYRMENIEKVFGSVDTLKADTLATMVQTMRTNLASIWRDPKVQEQNKTKRKDKDIQAEVLRGYEVAEQVLGDALEKYPEAWKLVLAKAAFAFDQNNYQAQLAKSADFVQKSLDAFADFSKAADMYVKAMPDLKEDERTADVFDRWFYASLGASDLAAVSHEHVPNAKQQALIKQRIEGLGEPFAKDHMDRFANNLSTRIRSVKPELKHRFLKAGLGIAGESKRAGEAKKVYDYYNDLVTEIELTAAIDGGDVVGHEQPFGLFVDIRHTKQIERESGGFTKYLTNQQNSPYAYNYGRPPENYRDKFEEAARETLKEHFEVVSVTFHSEKIQSRGDAEEGWRVTPYAYLLLKSRGPEVDEVPSLRMDMDFLDTSGFAVIPIETPRLPIDASKSSPGATTLANLKITQTLDERNAADGTLSLEIKATANGLVPVLDKLIDLKPAQFDVTNVQDEGVAVVQLDAESEENAVVSERNWVVEMKAKENLAAVPTAFQFASAKVETEENNFQRYEDADLADAQQTIALEQQYGEAETSSTVWVLIASGVFLLGLILWMIFSDPKDAAPVADSSFRLPEEVTPFSIITLLRRIREEGSLNDTQREELAGSITSLERHYFNQEQGEIPDLEVIAKDWIQKAA